MYEGFAVELAAVRTRKFHVVHMTPNERRQARAIEWPRPPPPSYSAFVARFGDAQLYRQPTHYLVRVFSSPLPRTDASGQEFLEFGGFDEGVACFKLESLGSEAESPVFEARGAGRPSEAAPSFAAWFERCVQSARKRYTRREWRAILDGPPPFTADELAIVQARERFAWRLVGVADNDELIFEVTNHSDRRLPFLSIDVFAPGLEGGVWLPVADVAPGATRLVQRAVYKGFVAPGAIQAYPRPAPEPEDRERYWEFKPLPDAG